MTSLASETEHPAAVSPATSHTLTPPGSRSSSPGALCKVSLRSYGSRSPSTATIGALTPRSSGSPPPPETSQETRETDVTASSGGTGKRKKRRTSDLSGKMTERESLVDEAEDAMGRYGRKRPMVGQILNAALDKVRKEALLHISCETIPKGVDKEGRDKIRAEKKESKKSYEKDFNTFHISLIDRSAYKKDCTNTKKGDGLTFLTPESKSRWETLLKPFAL